jgi:hypothetical protein
MRPFILATLTAATSILAFACDGSSLHPGAGGGAGGSGGTNLVDTSQGGQGGGVLVGAGGGGPSPADAGLSAIDVASVEMLWASSADAGATLYDVTVLPDGSATCRLYDGGWIPDGQSNLLDVEFQSLLATPGTVSLLSSVCPLRIADAGPTITTTFKSGAQVDHLVYGSCSSATLDALVAAIKRIGYTCIANSHLARDL